MLQIAREDPNHLNHILPSSFSMTPMSPNLIPPSITSEFHTHSISSRKRHRHKTHFNQCFKLRLRSRLRSLRLRVLRLLRCGLRPLRRDFFFWCTKCKNKRNITIVGLKDKVSNIFDTNLCLQYIQI